MGLLTAVKREANYLSAVIRMLKSVKTVDSESNFGISDELEMRVDKFAENLAFIDDDNELTYGHGNICQSCGILGSSRGL